MSCEPLPIPPDFSRLDEVLYEFFLRKYTMYHFLWQRSLVASPLCRNKEDIQTVGLPVTWLNTIWLNFFVESFGLKILSQVTTKLSQLHSNSRNKYVNSRKYHNVGQMRCMHARVGGNRSKERDRKSELVLRSTIPNF